MKILRAVISFMFIISASRKTDIPCRHSDWFFERLNEGYIVIQNPDRNDEFYHVSLTPDLVDGIVFWTKNPIPMLDRLNELNDFAYYFQFTITGYDQKLEPNIPDKDTVIIPAFKKLAKLIGPERVIWRYDPIIISDDYNFEYHIERFSHLAESLEGYTEKCIVGFLATYDYVLSSLENIGIQEPNLEQKRKLVKALVEKAREHGIAIESCKLELDFADIGVGYARCVDDYLFEKILGKPLNMDNQRLEAGCVSSVDIGTCNSCNNGCLYCFANFENPQLETNQQPKVKTLRQY